tara:strand:- start:173 stop:439 length:267 start_codon:yes stop_codon:yes gene_type:complete
MIDEFRITCLQTLNTPGPNDWTALAYEFLVFGGILTCSLATHAYAVLTRYRTGSLYKRYALLVFNFGNRVNDRFASYIQSEISRSSDG